MRLYRTVFEILSLIFQKLKRSRDSDHASFSDNLSSVGCDLLWCSICFDFVERTKFYNRIVRQCCLLLRHCCWCGRGLSCGKAVHGVACFDAYACRQTQFGDGVSRAWFIARAHGWRNKTQGRCCSAKCHLGRYVKYYQMHSVALTFAVKRVSYILDACIISK